MQILAGLKALKISEAEFVPASEAWKTIYWLLHAYKREPQEALGAWQTGPTGAMTNSMIEPAVAETPAGKEGSMKRSFEPELQHGEH